MKTGVFSPSKAMRRRWYLALAVAVSGGCQGPGPRQDGGPTQVERLARVYPELRGGRFAVVADFEDSRQMQLFQLVSISPEARRRLAPDRGRSETGTGCLEFTVGSPNDTLVITNEFATDWYLKRDWRPFDLLLLSLHAPRGDLRAEITVLGGPPRDQMRAHASIPLESGWNVVRLDLAEIGERIPLDDAREIRLSISGAAGRTEILLDDILLTGNREDLFGDSQDKAAGLYVQRVGRRWRIGAGGPDAGFEVTFANGQIVEWYNTAADPFRLKNLVRGTALGPATVPIGAADPGKAVAVRSRIVEMNKVRVVLTCEWRFADDPASARTAAGDQPYARWVYTIYSTGQMYVAVEASTRTSTWSAPQIGLAVTVASARDADFETIISTLPSETATARPTPFLLARAPKCDAALLYVVDDHDRPIEITETVWPAGKDSTATNRTIFMAVAEPTDGAIQSWTCHLLLGAASRLSLDDATARVLGYARPVSPQLQIGSFLPTDERGGLRDGFDTASGCYVIAPERGQVRLVIDGTKQPVYAPAFQIVQPGNSAAWVYVDHLIFEKVARDPGGGVIFQLPGVIRKRTLVEVLFPRSRSASGD